ncbi:MAG: ATP-binding cassette domain-containing protein [Candidatus Lokiarchaeota archaeon]|nr:ATP-binding cassette domain-containing protein [Candidatus Lokiarchaeota archaeon]MBD3199906.1 ATP-binding cassette domain-containing protein [Candidatus Lokiarchaeota archaeon]
MCYYYRFRNNISGGYSILYSIEIQNLNFSYNSKFNIEDLSLKIKKNEIFALIGNNGSGKTTLLRLIVGLLKPNSGDIQIFGEKLTRKKEQLWQLRQKIGFLFQNPDDQLFAPTIEEDVGFGARNMKLPESKVNQRVEWALKAVNLYDFRNESPFNLSWGQKKRACLAGLLVLQPKLLILDEPFANLDFRSILDHLKILESLRKQNKMTILFTTHNMFFVEHWADKMLVLSNGNKVFEGTPVEGLNLPEIKELIGSYDQIEEFIKKSRKSEV